MKIDPELRVQKINAWNWPRWWPVGALILLLSVAILPSYRALKRRERQTALGGADGLNSPKDTP
jgi:hypothetical protein